MPIKPINTKQGVIIVFEKFGEMGSCEEINELADNLLNEGDKKSLKAIEEKDVEVVTVEAGN